MTQKKSDKKLIVIAVAVILIIVLVKQSGISDAISLKSIRAMVDSLGFWGPIGFILVYALATSFGLPGTIITVAGGLIFGKWLGTLFNLIGAVLGSSGAFWIARLLARESLSEKFKGQKWFEKFNNGLEKDGFNYMLFVRLVPLFPYNGVNFGSGLTRIPFKSYLLGTAIGIIPGTFIFTNVAAEIGESATEGFSISPGIIMAFTLLGLFALIPIGYKKYKAGKEK